MYPRFSLRLTVMIPTLFYESNTGFLSEVLARTVSRTTYLPRFAIIIQQLTVSLLNHYSKPHQFLSILGRY